MLLLPEFRIFETVSAALLVRLIFISMRLLTYINKYVLSYILSNISDSKTVVNTFA